MGGGGEVEKKSLTITAFDGEIVLCPGKGICPIFFVKRQKLSSVIFLICWLASTNGEIIPLDHFSIVKKKKKTIGIFFSLQKA